MLLVSVNMGYGHQRTAFPLKDFAYNKEIIRCNDYPSIPKKDKAIWDNSRKFYELVSRFKRIPLIGELSFYLFDKTQEIKSFYPKRDLSSPNFILKRFHSLFKKGWGKDFIERYNSSLPMVNTFFVSAFMADYFGYKGEIYCVVCDADVSRTWAPYNPKESKIKYFASNSWTASRLKMYGVKKENIFLAGYPLPSTNVGGRKLEIVKEDMKRRLSALDPDRKYHFLTDRYFGKIEGKKKPTVAFSIGGAGAQKEMALEIINNISDKVNIIVMAGIRKEVRDFFKDNLPEEIKIIYNENIELYFEEFNKELRNVDILWTKPSELSFYSGLGIPIIIAPPIGSQEDFNKKWLLRMGAGISQENPSYAKDWFFDYLKSGRFAEASMNGFLLVEKMGTYNIKEICSG